MARLDIKIKPLTELEPHYDGCSIMQLRRIGRSVICEIYNNNKSATLLEVPQYAYDAVARGDFSTVGEIKEYIRNHPRPSPP